MSGPRTRTWSRTTIGLLAATGLVASLTVPALAGEEIVWATVTGHAEGTAENNQPETWGDNCENADVSGVDTWELPELAEGLVYSLVVVKAGSEASAPGFVNTQFANPSAGETVWADSDGDGSFSEADKGISHVIVCTEEEVEEPTPTPTPTPEVTPTPSPTPLGENPTPTPSPTPREDTAGGNPTPAPSGGALPDTAMGSWGQVPATVLSLVLLAALATLVYARMARQR